MCHDDCAFPVSGGAPIAETDLVIQTGNALPLPLFLTQPEQRPAPGTPGVLLLHDIHGPNAFYHDLARRLAGAGFMTALPDLFSRLEPATDSSRKSTMARGRQLDQPQALEDIRAALEWLRSHEEGTGKVGTIGFCMGGTLVMLAAARKPNPDASVAYYGFPKRPRSPHNSILPNDEAEIAALASPLLAFWGEEDSGVGMENVEAYRNEVTRHRKAHDFIVYPDVGHGFLTFDPTSDASSASQDSWARTLEFLGIHLDRPHYRA